MRECYDQACLVDVGCQYAGFFRQVARTPYDVVGPWLDVGYVGTPVGID